MINEIIATNPSALAMGYCEMFSTVGIPDSFWLYFNSYLLFEFEYIIYKSFKSDF